MKALHREIIAIAVAGSLLFTRVTLYLPVPHKVVIFVLAYAVLRSFIPVSRPRKLSDEDKQLRACRRTITSMQDRAGTLSPGELQTDVLALGDVFEQLLQRAEKNGEQAALLEHLPGRVEKLDSLLTRYTEVAAGSSPSAGEALAQCESVFRKSREQFQALLDHRLEADAMDLKIDARITEELMEFGDELEQVRGNLERE